MLTNRVGALAVRSRFFFDLGASQGPYLSLQCSDPMNTIDQCTILSQQQCLQEAAGVVCQSIG